MNSGVYVIQNTVSKKCYVGSAVDFGTRWKTHRSHLANARHANRHLQASWDKHGAEAFRFWIAEECEPERLLEREQWWLDMFEPFDRDGFNLARIAGSTLGMKWSGKPLSQEKREHLRNVNLGKKHSAETRAKMSAARKGRERPEGVIRKFVEAARVANTGRVQSPEEVARRVAACAKANAMPGAKAKRADAARKRWETRLARYGVKGHSHATLEFAKGGG